MTPADRVESATERCASRAGMWLLAASCLPPLFVLWVIRTYGVNVPFLDEWVLVPFVLEADQGAATFADFWAPHNEHRIATVRVLVRLVLPITRFDATQHLVVAFAFALASFLILRRTLLMTFGSSGRSLVALALVAASALMFSVVQYEAWLHFLPALQWQITTFCAVLATWAIARWPGSSRALWVSAGCTIVGALCISSGLALWPLAVCGVLATAPAKNRWAVLAVGLLATVTFATLYFADLRGVGSHVDLWQMARRPRQGFRFFTGYLGAPLGLHGGIDAAAWIGTIGLGISVWIAWTVWRTCPRHAAAPWLVLLLYALAVDGITAVGRSGLGPNAALARRYPATAALFWIAVVALSGLAAAHRPRRQGERNKWMGRMAMVTVAAGVVAYAGANRFAYLELRGGQQRLEIAHQEVLFHKTAQPDIFRFLNPSNPDIVRDSAARLETAGLGPFKEWGASK